MIPEQFTLNTTPVAADDATICVGNARFTVLTERLIRLEYAPNGQFEDRATQTMWYRQQPVPPFTAKSLENGVTIETAAFLLRYEASGPFTTENLSIQVKASDTIWHPGEKDTNNLKGTTRTLDYIDGYTPLTDGLISRAGWAVVDDSKSFVFNQQHWLEPRAEEVTDWYFFAYGQDYKAALQDYCAISGEMPLVPRWILGNWWSRYWAYTQDELVTLINDFQTHEIPLSVCIVDMDWHITKTNNDSTGWTGYTWNRDLFPDPQKLIDFFHEKGLRTALNLHPAEGVHRHEAQYKEMAERLGRDPESGEPIAFDITDPEFVKAYFEVLHHPYEKMGVDFWWMDWQQGLTCKIPNLDPLWLINHLHFLDMGRDQAQRPFIFSRWGNEGHQRYPIGFSGDSYMTWETLRFEPYLTATASNIAYGWWSHDIGGHVSGTGDPELFTRWVQFGVFSPIMRIHSTTGHFYDQRPWKFESAEVREVLQKVMQLRHAMIPYLYTMAWRAHQESLPLMLPTYYNYPNEEAAYHCPQQYLFGTELIVAPFVDPTDPDTRLSRQVVWLPEGDWVHFMTGEHYKGNQWHPIYGTLKDIPIFAKAGAIVPLGAATGWGGIDNPDELHIHLFAGASNAFTLYEDDGKSLDYRSGGSAKTTIAQDWSGNKLQLTINPAEGDTALLPVERTIHVQIHGVHAGNIVAQIDGTSVQINSAYDEATEILSIDGIPVKPTSTLTLQLKTEDESLLSWRDRKRETYFRLLKSFRLNTGVRNRLADMADKILDDPDQIAPYLMTMQDSQVRALCEVLYEAGFQHVPDTHKPTLLILWNNRDDQDITYRYGDAYLFFGQVTVNHDHGIVPHFTTFTPEIKTWTRGAAKEHVQRTQWQVQLDYHNLASVTGAYREKTR